MRTAEAAARACVWEGERSSPQGFSYDIPARARRWPWAVSLYAAEGHGGGGPTRQVCRARSTRCRQSSVPTPERTGAWKALLAGTNLGARCLFGPKRLDDDMCACISLDFFFSGFERAEE